MHAVEEKGCQRKHLWAFANLLNSMLNLHCECPVPNFVTLAGHLPPYIDSVHQQQQRQPVAFTATRLLSRRPLQKTHMTAARITSSYAMSPSPLVTLLSLNFVDENSTHRHTRSVEFMKMRCRFRGARARTDSPTVLPFGSHGVSVASVAAW